MDRAQLARRTGAGRGQPAARSRPAFGTGTHPTTALCPEWLDAQTLDDRSLLDFGCGSGILAIAGLLLGARRAVGTDIDPQALEASRDNAERNGIAPERFTLYLPEQLPQEPADVVVANILAGPLVSLAQQINALVKPGGRLALSGILAEQADEVRGAYSGAFDLDPTADKDGWYASAAFVAADVQRHAIVPTLGQQARRPLPLRRRLALD